MEDEGQANITDKVYQSAAENVTGQAGGSKKVNLVLLQDKRPSCLMLC